MHRARVIRVDNAKTKNNRGQNARALKEPPRATRGSARRNAFRDGFAGFALYVHFYLSGRLSAVFHALYVAVVTFKIARCTTQRVQIYFPLPHTSSYRLLRVGCTVVLWSLHSPPRSCKHRSFPGSAKLFLFSLFVKNSTTLIRDNIFWTCCLKRILFSCCVRMLFSWFITVLQL